MNMKNWLYDIKSSKEKKAFPILSFPGISLIDTTVDKLIASSDLQAECMKAITSKYPTLAAVSLMDLSVEAECFGSKIRFSSDEVPTVIGNIADTPEDVEALQIPEVGTFRTGIYIEAVRKACDMITDRPVFAGAIGPFSLAGRLLDMTNIMIYCLDEPEMVHILLEKVSEFITQYIKAFKSAGANGIVIAEPAAGLLSPSLNSEFSVPYIKKIIENVKDDNFAVVYHNCGQYTIRQIDDILTVGASIYHFGDAIDLNEMKEHIPSDVLFSGNISPSNCFRNGTPDIMREATAQLLKSCGDFSNFIPSSGCDIPPSSNHDNIQTFFDEVKTYYKS